MYIDVSLDDGPSREINGLVALRGDGSCLMNLPRGEIDQVRILEIDGSMFWGICKEQKRVVGLAEFPIEFKAQLHWAVDRETDLAVLNGRLDSLAQWADYHIMKRGDRFHTDFGLSGDSEGRDRGDLCIEQEEWLAIYGN